MQDLSPLSYLSALESIDLQSNLISDVSALRDLPNLRFLDLTWNDDLEEPVYAYQLQDIVDQNPGVRLYDDGNPNPPSQVNASQGSMRRAVHLSWNSVPNGPHFTSHYQVYRASATDRLSSIEFGDTVAITAVPSDPSLFSFVGWSGAAVDYASVHAPTQAATFVTVDDPYDLKAHFVTHLAALHVDDDTPDDPDPNDGNLSDPNENGTPEHPFDGIQEAIS